MRSKSVIKSKPELESAEVMFWIRIREVLGTSRGQDIGYPDKVFRDFPQFLQENSEAVPQ
jgi:hypothetical protein